MRSRPLVLALLLSVLAVVAAAPLAAADDERVPHVWVYSGTQNFRHASIPHAKAVLADLAARTGAFTVEFTEDPADLTSATLARTDVALFLSPSGFREVEVFYVNRERAPFDAQQRAAFVEWIGCGGGFVGVHQAADSYDDWPEWDELVGAKFLAHPVPGELRTNLRVAAQAHPATKPWHGQQRITLTDEFYAWTPQGRPEQLTSDFAPLLRFDGFADPQWQATWGPVFAEDQPLAWTSTFRGRNRSFYTNLGHAAATWDRPDFQQHLLGGIAWVAEHRVDRTCAAG